MGLRDWLRRRRAAPPDPVRAFDDRIDALGQRARALRRSAVTLLALRSDLDRQIGRLRAAAEDLRARMGEADPNDPELQRVLRADLQQELERFAQASGQHAKVTEDAAELTRAVKAVEAELEQLMREREAARVRLEASKALVAMQPGVETRIEDELRLDQARDEIERAHALAEIYREEERARREGK